jgi:hypothetical protein
MRLWVLVQLAALFFVAQLVSAQSVPAPQGGTLIVVLASRNGAVIASDSRRSSPGTPFNCRGKIQRFCDDSQKVFVTGPKSAVAIAGFANGDVPGITGTPVNVEVASVFRRMFKGRSQDSHSNDVDVVAIDSILCRLAH